MRRIVSLLAAGALAAGCGNSTATFPSRQPVPSTVSPAESATAQATPVATPRPTASTIPAATLNADGSPETLRKGLLGPGRYRYRLQPWCPGDAPCSPDVAPPVNIDLTVPAGWEGAPDFGTITPAGSASPDYASGGAIVLGWTTAYVGLYTDPCSIDDEGHPPTDIPVGPTVDDFVSAVQAHPTFVVSKPRRVELGGHKGRFFTLKGPSDISGCDDWRPWDPGIYVQGPNNIWDVWVMDIGYRVVIVAQYFPDTPERIRTEMGQIVMSIEFEEIA